MSALGGVRGLIAGGVRNRVLANLMMVTILAGGYFSMRGMVREAYPEFSLEHIAVDVVYPGASPEDVERAVCTPIEEAVRGISNVRQVSSSSRDNGGTVWVGVRTNVKDVQLILNQVKDRVDQITTFPKEVERPVVHHATIRAEVINVAVYGSASERTLKRVAQDVRDDLSAYPEISQISLSGVRADEIIIEISEEALRAYDLSLSQVLDAVRKSSLDLPAGLIRTRGEEVMLRVTGQRFAARDYEDLVILEHGDAVVRLGDIARAREGFEEAITRGRFNGQPAAVVSVFKTPEEDTTKIAAIVREYVESHQSLYSGGLKIAVWGDSSIDVDGRVNLLIENGLIGIVLVFITLLLFLELRVAFWVAVGIPVSFSGAIIILHAYGETLNMISLFGLIMVSGVIVDDAIVIAESIHSRRRNGMEPELASTEGAHRVMLPVIGATITTIIAFLPLSFVSGVMGRFIRVLPVVVVAALAASTLEAFGILPSHLAEKKPGVGSGAPSKPSTPNPLRRKLQAGIDTIITKWYRPVFRVALRARLVTLSLAAAGLLFAAGLVFGGRTPFVLLPKENSNGLRARVRFPQGTPLSITDATILRMEEAAQSLNDDEDLKPSSPGDLVQQTYSISGEFADFLSLNGSHLGEVRLELMAAEDRGIDDQRIIERWRERIGTVHDAVEFTISRKQLGPTERPIEIRLLGDNFDDLTDAARHVEAKLAEFEGVTDISLDLVPGKRELHVALGAEGRSLGLTLEDVARELRSGFFGGEAVRLQRGREQVKVRVRFPLEERRSVADVEAVRIATPQGDEVPLLEVADLTWSRGYANIMHESGKRRVRVLADVDERRTNAEQILQALSTGFLDELVGNYNGMKYNFGGNRERMDESLTSLFNGLAMALIGIYAVLAVLLRSYVQPVVILAAVPFGLIGVVAGHAVVGLDLTLMSLFGAVALSGVVVNDSLVLLDAINRGIREGQSVRDSVYASGEFRFRAVTLTSMTTIAGLSPLLLEQSSQAQSVRPMALSLAAGLMFATVLTLFVVPAMYLAVNDVRRFLRWLRYGGGYPAPEQVEEAAEQALTVQSV